MSIDKNTQAQVSFWKYFRIVQQDKPSLFPIPSCYTCTGSYLHSQDQFIMYNTYGKENTDNDDEVKGTYIWLSCTLAVVMSAVKGTTILPVVHVRCSLYPKIHPLV